MTQMTRMTQIALHLTLSLALISGPTSAASEVSVNEAGGFVSFATSKSHGQAQLVVTGPDGFRVERSFDQGEVPNFSIHEGFDTAQDGSYTWSLTVASEIDDELRGQMEEARAMGDDEFIDRARDAGFFESYTYTGAFTRKAGRLVMPSDEQVFHRGDDRDVPNKDQVIQDDLITIGSACIGLDCVNGESFGFDTLRLKENNLRIKFEDTSGSASFPHVDWELVANDSTNGGLNRFSIEDSTNTKEIFTLEAEAPNNSLYVSSSGFVGVGTNQPAVGLQVTDGNSPTLRLEQDGSDGFAAQSWDLAGNEVNFFLRDVTNGSSLPFRVRAKAPKNSLFIDFDGDVGLGTENPDAQLDVRGDVKIEDTLTVEKQVIAKTDLDVQGQLTVNNSTGQNLLLNLSGSGNRAQMQIGNFAGTWRYDVNSTGQFTIIDVINGVNALQINPSSGDTTIAGTLTAAIGGTNLTFPDYVFDEDYDLLPLEEVAAFIEENGHLPRIPSASEVEGTGEINMSKLQLKLLEKIEELTLYTLAQEETIKNLEERLNAIEGR